MRILMNAFARVPFLADGDLIRYRRLGSVATYRARGRRRDLVELEAIEVPGLQAGRRFMFARDAVAKMERVSLEAQGRRPAPSS
jgi:hypothetical protein